MLTAIQALGSGVSGLSISLVGTYLHSRRKGAEAIDAIFRQELATRSAELTRQKEIIEGQARTIEALQKPVRSPAEAHRYAAARSSLDEIGPDSVTVLRHLRTHCTLKFSNVDPPAPQGMNSRDARAILNLCVAKGLATVSASQHPGGYYYTYSIPEAMHAVLDELLYPPA
jgi:hypothetical protein